MAIEPADAASLAMQGLVDTDWATPENAALARLINEKARAVADAEMEPGLSSTDFAGLLAESARIAQDNANS
ncbi:hypothetical protein ASD12_11800 [Mesorhizobium sp. Root102]|uniref:hypothetical protein n=1 Tax=Mesorhizobium sp. Root102 TaxID=1736422 RepID=UPI0006F3FD29|nr:hypothetical protein [Mesorhizobium sp. Root102]KQU80086.1 hypothetical protein ASD12_11800 [Mesorhizobium sp. Root102]